MALVRLNLITEGLNRLLFQFKDKPRIAAWLTSYLQEFQEIEDSGWAIWTQRVITAGLATGDLLAKLGKLVGQTSEGLGDPEFAVLIQARIKANRSSGRRADLIAILSTLVPTTQIIVKDYPPASVYLFANGPVAISPALIAFSFLIPAVDAGVRLLYAWTQLPIADTFLFGDSGGGFTPTVAQTLTYLSGGAPVAGGGALAGVFQSQGS